MKKKLIKKEEISLLVGDKVSLSMTFSFTTDTEMYRFSCHSSKLSEVL